MIIIDPLRQKIETLLIEGQSNPLNQARQKFGTEEDIEVLIREFEVQMKNTGSERYICIDLTPFERVGRLDKLVNKLAPVKDPIPILMVMSESIVSSLKMEFDEIPITVAVFSNDGNFAGIEGNTSIDNEIRQDLIHGLMNGLKSPNLEYLRREVSDKNLTQLLFNPYCLDIPHRNDLEKKSDKESVYIGGRYYRVMTNNMLVSCYLNLKQIGSDYKSLTLLAYEVLLDLMNYFRRDVDALSDFDLLVVPNNTALFLASCIQAIIEKPIITIDKLGPIPSLQLPSTKLERLLSGKRVIVIEEVVAAGNEVDRTLMFLNHMKANLIKIIAVYNLEVGKPLLLKENQMVSLCKPKEELKYVYRSK